MIMSDKPLVRCPHCEEHIEAKRLASQRKYRNEFGLDIFECPECHQRFKFEPSEYFVALEGIEKGEIPSRVAIAGAKVEEILPSEQAARLYDRTPTPKRFVPLITGVFALLLSALLIFGFESW